MASQGIGCQESYREQGEANEWRRSRTLGNTRSQMECDVSHESIGIPGASSAACLHSEIEWEGAPSGHSHHARPSDAGSSPARAGPGCGVPVGPEQLRLSDWPINARRSEPVVRVLVQEGFGPMDSGRGHLGILRQHQSRMVASPRSHEPTRSPAVVEIRRHRQRTTESHRHWDAARWCYLTDTGEHHAQRVGKRSGEARQVLSWLQCSPEGEGERRPLCG